jgi:lysophospholipase L1-like esterase
MKKSYIVIALAACSLTACKPNLRSDSPSANGVDFSRYVAVGNSLTAGYADGSLYKSGQLSSYPAILAEQFKQVGGGAFVQPLMNTDVGYPSPKLVLKMVPDCFGGMGLAPVPYALSSDTSDAHTSVVGPYNNVGIPGIRAIDYLQPAYAFFNPYAGRFFANPLGTALDEATRIDPTFFTMWLGSNDVLGYALAGGEGNALPISPDNISNIADFKTAYDSVVKTMIRGGAKGVLLNLPDITSIPFFTTIPAKGLSLTTSDTAVLNTYYRDQGSPIRFTPGDNYFVVQDPSVTGGMRKAVAGELILLSLPQDSLKCGMWGSMKPIPKKYVLSTTEIASIANATTAFNDYIHMEAINYGLAFADMNSYMKTVIGGIKFNGVDFTTQYIGGGAFSLDGVHLTPRGYALVANRIIQATNDFYKSRVPMVDVNKYSGIRFP